LVLAVAIIIAVALAILPYVGWLAVTIGVLFLLGLILFASGRLLRRIGLILKQKSGGVSSEDQPAALTLPEQPLMRPDESLISHLKQRRSELVAAEEAEASKASRQLSEDGSVEDAKERIKAAGDWLNESGIGEALQEILPSFSYPTWSSSWKPLTFLCLQEPRAWAKRVGEIERYFFDFVLDGHRFAIAYEHDNTRPWKKDHWEKLSLGYDGAEVFRGTVLGASAPPHWGKVSNVRILVVGEWTTTLLELASRVRLKRQRELHEQKVAEAAAIRANAAALPPSFPTSPSRLPEPSPSPISTPTL
jgi:hypothetical protein